MAEASGRFQLVDADEDKMDAILVEMGKSKVQYFFLRIKFLCLFASSFNDWCLSDQVPATRSVN